jgi:hypothetical protein
MINGVLTERTVKEVVPILQTNSDGLKKALEELVKQYKSKQDEMEKWKVCVAIPFLPLETAGSLRRAHGHKTDFGITEEEQCPSCSAAWAIEFQFMQQSFDRLGAQLMLGATWHRADEHNREIMNDHAPR